ncbi:MAG TPA: PA2779 family protein [Nitrospiria bacterium]|nr:PA2779 family protein [Nitrospiria bacterium]
MFPLFLTRLRFLIVWMLVVTTFSLAVETQGASAALLPSEATLDMGIPGPDRESSIKKIQAVLESRIIGQRLADLGLTPEEITSRLDQLSDQQAHEIATQLDALQPGGDALGTVVLVLVIAILVVILLQLTGHKIIITK